MQDRFRTVVTPRTCPRPLAVGGTTLCLGSCFADVVGSRLARHGFAVDTNPFGALYNPSSVVGALERIAQGRRYSGCELFLHDGLWRSFDHHAALAAPSRMGAVRRINVRFDRAVQVWRDLRMLVVTFGTAQAWVERESGRVVANCHRLPGDRFERRLLSADDIVAQWEPFILGAAAANPALSIVLTVSPVRYLQSDAHQNSVSKGQLHIAVDRLCRRCESVYYFPAYEIVIDELRDYRFFAADHAHVSAEAEEYVWERFVEYCCDAQAQRYEESVRPLVRAMGHRVETPLSPSAHAFAAKQLARADALQKEYPRADLSHIRSHFAALLD